MLVGHIPGKAKGGECWFPYGGKEHSTSDFHYFDGSSGSAPNEGTSHSEPQRASPFPPGHQNDGGGDLWCAIANTHHGFIPGKAKDGTCWYPYGGEEHTTDEYQLASGTGAGFQVISCLLRTIHAIPHALAALAQLTHSLI